MDNIRHTHFSRNPKIAQFLKAYKYVKEFDSPSTAQVEKLVAVMNDDYVDVPEMMKLCGIVRRKTMQDSYIAPALTDGSIERKYPEQPNHPKQMYSLSEKAKAWKKTNNWTDEKTVSKVKYCLWTFCYACFFEQVDSLFFC